MTTNDFPAPWTDQFDVSFFNLWRERGPLPLPIPIPLVILRRVEISKMACGQDIRSCSFKVREVRDIFAKLTLLRHPLGVPKIDIGRKLGSVEVLLVINIDEPPWTCPAVMEVEGSDHLALKIMNPKIAGCVLEDECRRFSRDEYSGKSTNIRKTAHWVRSLPSVHLNWLVRNLNRSRCDPFRGNLAEPKATNRSRNCIRGVKHYIIAALGNH